MLAHDEIPRYTVAEVARLADAHPNTVRSWIRNGLLAAERHGPRNIRISPAAWEKFRKGVNTPPPDPIKEAALRVVEEAPRLTPDQLDKICALLRGAA